MYSRVTRMHFRVPKVAVATKIFKENIVPASKKQKGFRGMYLLSNEDTGHAMSITFWNEKEDAVANDHSGLYQEQVDKIIDFMESPPIPEDFTVSLRSFR